MAEGSFCYSNARAYFETGKFDRTTDYLGKSLKLNPEFKEGKAFYNYLLKLNPKKENKIGSIFQRIFHPQKSSLIN